MQSRHFTQYELEFAIGKCLSFGDEDDIAKGVGKSSGMISQYLDPGCERESPIFKAAAILTAWIDANPDDGQKALQTFNSFVGRAYPAGEALDLNLCRRRSHTERTDFVIVESENGCLDDRIRELEESMDADAILLKALKGERTRQKQSSVFAGQPVNHTARSIGAAAVGGRNGEK